MRLEKYSWMVSVYKCEKVTEANVGRGVVAEHVYGVQSRFGWQSKRKSREYSSREVGSMIPRENGD